MYNIEKQTTDSTSLVSNRCWEAGGRKRERDWLETSWINCFSVFMLYAAWKRGLPRKIARFVQFRPDKKRSFNLLCVLDLFSERWQSALFQIFLYKIVSECSASTVTRADGHDLIHKRIFHIVLFKWWCRSKCEATCWFLVHGSDIRCQAWGWRFSVAKLVQGEINSRELLCLVDRPTGSWRLVHFEVYPGLFLFLFEKKSRISSCVRRLSFSAWQSTFPRICLGGEN